MKGKVENVPVPALLLQMAKLNAGGIYHCDLLFDTSTKRVGIVPISDDNLQRRREEREDKQGSSNIEDIINDDEN